MTTKRTTRPAPAAPRRQRSDGQRSRDAILRTAAGLATLEGLTGLSLGRLADAVGMSKSGLFAHFGSKEELQLATIETAAGIYNDVVVRPGLEAATGRMRLEALAERFLDHVENAVFPGGCFFASVSAEVDTQSGPLRDRAMVIVAEWFGHLRTAIETAQAEGDIDPAEDADQLAFEINAYLLLANAQFVATGQPGALNLARRAIRGRLAVATPPAPPSRRRAAS